MAVAYYAHHQDFDSNRGLNELKEAFEELIKDCNEDPYFIMVLYKISDFLQIYNISQNLTDANHPFNKYANDVESPDMLIDKLHYDITNYYANKLEKIREIVFGFFDANGENRGVLEDLMWDYWNYVNKALNIHQDD